MRIAKPVVDKSQEGFGCPAKAKRAGKGVTSQTASARQDKRSESELSEE
jgi:hypothetical protein